jgi:hypothetical protein
MINSALIDELNNSRTITVIVKAHHFKGIAAYQNEN